VLKKVENKVDLCIIGGGASGFFAAATLIEKMPDANIVILEQGKSVLQKVKISGGGRCNVTNAVEDKNEFAKHYPRGAKAMRQRLYDLSNTDIVRWFEDRNVPMKAEADGRMFPVSNSSQSIIDCLHHATIRKGVELLTSCKVMKIEKLEGQFVCSTTMGDIVSKHVLVASGGVQSGSLPSFIPVKPSEWITTVPSLFTFKVNPFDLVDYAGVSFENATIDVQFGKQKYTSSGPLLITHWGFSGPSVLKLSSKLAFDANDSDYNFSFTINFINAKLDETDAALLKLVAEQGKALVKNKYGFDVSKRFWQYIIQISGVKPEERWSDINKQVRKNIARNLTQMPFQANGKSMFKEEFVAAGGIDLKALKAKSYEHKEIDNLYFSGEILNVDGFTGGFNFQNAWCSGFAVANDIEKKLC
jgi:predicted Rossmann fold flavoprotein